MSRRPLYAEIYAVYTLTHIYLYIHIDIWKVRKSEKNKEKLNFIFRLKGALRIQKKARATFSKKSVNQTNFSSRWLYFVKTLKFTLCFSLPRKYSNSPI